MEQKIYGASKQILEPHNKKLPNYNILLMKYCRHFGIICLLLLISSCKNESKKIGSNTENKSANQIHKFILYPVIGDNSEFSNKLRMSLKEVIEYKFSQEVILQDYIPQDTTEVRNDLNILDAKKGLICKINDLNLFFPNKIFFRCLVFKKGTESTKIDITKKLLATKEEKTAQEKNPSYKLFDVYIDLNDKASLQEATKILERSSFPEGFLVENVFLKQENFLFVIKEKFTILAKNYLFDP